MLFMCHSMKKLTWAKGFIVSIKKKQKQKQIYQIIYIQKTVVQFKLLGKL